MAKPNALIGSLALWIIFSSIGAGFLQLSPGEAIIGGLIATLLHWLGDFWHQLNHAWAARRTGYPMSGIVMIWVLAPSFYPRDEGELPAAIHIWRALGGPIGSLFLTLGVGAFVPVSRSLGSLAGYLVLFFFLDNLLVFTLGALLPLGFTDGSTLLRYWGKQ